MRATSDYLTQQINGNAVAKNLASTDLNKVKP